MDTNQMVEIYKVFRDDLHMSIDLHRQQLQHYLAFVAAVFAATVAGFYQVHGLGWQSSLLAIGPLLNIIISYLAIKMCDRFYEGMLEDITITAKLEELIGLMKPRDSFASKGATFPGDKFLLPERWLEGRGIATTAEFVKKNMDKGANRIARRTFQLSLIVNAIFAVVLILVAVF